MGDLNWQPAYRVLEAGEWAFAPSVPTVHGGKAAPTRCLLQGARCEKATTEALPGVPHHLATTYVAGVEAPDRQARDPPPQARSL